MKHSSLLGRQLKPLFCYFLAFAFLKLSADCEATAMIEKASSFSLICQAQPCSLIGFAKVQAAGVGPLGSGVFASEASLSLCLGSIPAIAVIYPGAKLAGNVLLSCS